tara:strand:- start:48 stop:680 length:633 start_codon:yes stop_codon:yes gene_type:complete
MARLVGGECFKSANDGLFYIVEDNGWDNVSIIFASGYLSKATRNQIKTGKVKDRFKRTYCNVGFVGGIEFKTKGKSSKAYYRWRHMILRCYDESTQDSMPTYKGCSVCDEWHNYQNYAKWFADNFIQGFDVDKDILVNGNKIYSPETCKFVSHQENSEKATAKEYQLRTPEGRLINVYNLNKFCTERNLTQSNMRKVINGDRKHHKGWTL